jgi:hypothetical protein
MSAPSDSDPVDLPRRIWRRVYWSLFRPRVRARYERAIGSLCAVLPALRWLPLDARAHIAIKYLLSRDRVLVVEARLWNLYRLTTDPGLPAGALVECGVAKGGCLALMSLLSAGKRQVWGFDSFEAMPAQSPEDEGDGECWVGVDVSGGLGEARRTLDALHVEGDWVRLVPGWFEDTLPKTEIGPIAVLRLDNDWYASTKFCLERLYDRVANGGAVVVDDYHTFVGCRKAVDEFRAARGIRSPLVTTDPGGEAWWRKEA